MKTGPVMGPVLSSALQAPPATGKRLFACGKSGQPQSIRAVLLPQYR